MSVVGAGAYVTLWSVFDRVGVCMSRDKMMLLLATFTLTYHPLPLPGDIERQEVYFHQPACKSQGLSKGTDEARMCVCVCVWREDGCVNQA